jgi:hypothetical protein
MTGRCRHRSDFYAATNLDEDRLGRLLGTVVRIQEHTMTSSLVLASRPIKVFEARRKIDETIRIVRTGLMDIDSLNHVTPAQDLAVILRLAPRRVE